MRVVLHIDRLVVDGVPLAPMDAGAVSAALLQALAGELRAGTLPTSSTSADRVRSAEPLWWRPGQAVDEVGKKIATAILEVLP